MLVSNFIDSCAQYRNFEIWDINSLKDFLEGNGVLGEIFTHAYKIPASQVEERRNEIDKTDMEIMKHLLDQIGDKHFLIFTLYDANHQELIMLQDKKIMNFGIDISKIEKDHVYIMLMDKAN